MNTKRAAFLSGWVLAAGFIPALAGVKAEPPGARAAVERALPPLQKGAQGYVRQRGCFSCHHQTLPVLALALARDRGFAVDAKVLAEQVEFTHASTTAGREAYRGGRGQGGGVSTAGYALWALEAGDRKPDETTAAMSEFLLLREKEGGPWRTSAKRPPSEASSFASTYLAVRGLQVWGTAEQKERIRARLDKARAWLLETPAGDTEDRVFRLWALHRLGAPEAKAAAEELKQQQRPDGGWAQVEGMESDAYAAGSALTALHETGSVRSDEALYRRGVQFLVGAQQPDGTWHVVSRSKPFQPYFESGFPYGKDQFISAAGSSWATAALALSFPSLKRAPRQ